MPTLDELAAIKYGTTDVVAVYLGDTLLWEPPDDFTPLDITWAHAFWASDPFWTPPSDGGTVSSWRNAGTAGTAATQATGTRQPLYRSSVTALNNKAGIQFDGTDDNLGLTIAGMAQPLTVVAIGNWAAGTTIFDTANPRVNLDSRGASNKYRMGAGTTVTAASGTPDGNVHFAVAIYNGATSSLTVDGTSVISANVGTNTSGTTVTFGSDRSFLAAINGHLAFLGFHSGTFAGTELTDLRAWAQSYYGTP